MTRCPSKPRGYPTPSMAAGEKPYRVYRGGRVKGKVPLERPQARPDRNGRGARASRRSAGRDDAGAGSAASASASSSCSCSRSCGRSPASSPSGSGVDKANERLEPSVKATLADQNGLLLSNETHDPPARTRLREQRSPCRSQQHRLDHDPAHGSEQAPFGLPLDSRATCECRFRDTARTGSTRRCHAAASRSRSGRSQGFTGLGINHVMIVDFAPSRI